MSFSQELKDFTKGFEAGYKMVDTPSRKEMEAKRERDALKLAQDQAENGPARGVRGAAEAGTGPTSTPTTAEGYSRETPAPSMAAGQGGGRTMTMPVDPAIKAGIESTAKALGVSPVELATIISYETAGTFSPTKGGPTTQWGRHRGLIQFGEPQAKKFGVDWNNPIESQLGPDGAVAKYMRDAGVKPGMGLLDMYSAVNAGRVGRYNASDANNGGAPGTVRDKVEKQMGGHRAKAMAMFGSQPASAPAPTPAPATTALPVQRATVETPAWSSLAPTPATPVAARPVPAPTTVTRGATPVSAGPPDQSLLTPHERTQLTWDEQRTLAEQRKKAATPGPQAAIDFGDNEVGVYAAEGGLVPDLSNDDSAWATQEQIAPREAVPIARPPGPAPAPADTRETVSARQFVEADVSNPIADGLKYIQKIFGFDQAAGIGQVSPRGAQGQRAFASNAFAATPDEVAEVDRTIDPGNQLTADERALARLNAGYDFYVKRGEPEKAQKYATSMLMYSRKAAQTMGGIAIAAGERGDKMGMAKALQKGYAETPDGQKLEVSDAGGDAVAYRVTDAEGNITSQGKARIDEMMRMATGMVDGTEWLTQITNPIKRKSAAEARREREEGAIDAYENSGADTDAFLSSMTEERRKAYLAMPASAQRQARKAWKAEQDENAVTEFDASRSNDEFLDTFSPIEREKFDALPTKQKNLVRQQWATKEGQERLAQFREQNRADLKDRFDKRQALQMFKAEQAQGRWEKTREQVMSNFERSLAQRDRDLSDRNVRHQESAEARQRRYDQLDQRILEQRDERRARDEQRRKDDAAKAAIPKTAGERADAAIDTMADQQRSSIAADPGDVEQQVGLAREVNPSVAIDPSMLSGENYGPTAPQLERFQAVEAGRGYAKSANDRKVGARDRKQFDEDAEKITTAISTEWGKNPDRPGFKPLTPEATQQFTNVAQEIRDANQITAEDAARIAMVAARPGVQPRILPDGRVQFDPRLPPVMLSEDAFLRLAALRGRAAQANGRRTEAAPTAVPGRTGNPLPARALPTAAQQEAIRQEMGRVRPQALPITESPLVLPPSGF